MESTDIQNVLLGNETQNQIKGEEKEETVTKLRMKDSLQEVANDRKDPGIHTALWWHKQELQT